MKKKKKKRKTWHFFIGCDWMFMFIEWSVYYQPEREPFNF